MKIVSKLESSKLQMTLRFNCKILENLLQDRYRFNALSLLNMRINLNIHYVKNLVSLPNEIVQAVSTILVMLYVGD